MYLPDFSPAFITIIATEKTLIFDVLMEMSLYKWKWEDSVASKTQRTIPVGMGVPGRVTFASRGKSFPHALT